MNYKIGNAENDINVEVKVDTAGSAHTVVVLRKTTGPVGIILESEETNGHIPPSYVGEAAELKGGRITVTVNVSLAGVSPEDREDSVGTISSEITLSGGEEGTVSYSSEKNEMEIAPGNMTAVITKVISFK